MRVSSATRPSSRPRGTLKSTRTSAVLPLQSTSRMVQRRRTWLLADRGGGCAFAAGSAPASGVADDLLEHRAVRRGAAAYMSGDESGDVRQATRVAVLVVVPA